MTQCWKSIPCWTGVGNSCLSQDQCFGKSHTTNLWTYQVMGLPQNYLCCTPWCWASHYQEIIPWHRSESLSLCCSWDYFAWHFGGTSHRVGDVIRVWPIKLKISLDISWNSVLSNYSMLHKGQIYYLLRKLAQQL